MNLVKPLIKIAIALTLIIYLMRSGKMDFSLLADSLAYPEAWFACFALMLANILLTTARWRWLLHLKSQVQFKFLSILKLTWIGLLFNSVLPGAVSGDVIKLLYARDIDSSLEKSFLITTVLLDRIFGLCGIIGVLGISSLFHYEELISRSPELGKLVQFNFLLFSGVIIFFLTLFIPESWQNTFLNSLKRLPRLQVLASKTIGQFWHVGKNRLVVFKAFFLSLFIQCLNIGAFYIVTKPFYDAPLPIEHAYTFIPIGLVSIAIPITPSGLGIGHAAFDKLFHLYGISRGASLFNFYFVATTLLNLLGIIPYLGSGKKHTAKEAKSVF